MYYKLHKNIISFPHDEGVEERHLLVIFLFCGELDTCVIRWVEMLSRSIYTTKKLPKR